MYNFFDRQTFVDLCEDDDNGVQNGGGHDHHHRSVQIRLAAFSKVNRLSENDKDIETMPNNNAVRLNCDYRCVLATNDSRLLLCQIDYCAAAAVGEGDEREHVRFRTKKFWIPLDEGKGEVVAMCFNRSATHLLAVTTRSLIYQIPFKFSQRQCPLYGLDRIFHDEEAVVISTLTLVEPSAICWWERETISQNSIAIIGNRQGRISFIDLSTASHAEFRHFSVPACIVTLQLFDEMYYRSLLIDCDDGHQYQMMMEAFRSFQNYPYHQSASNSSDGTPTSFSLASLSSSMSYLSCMLEAPEKSVKRKRGSWLSLKRTSKDSKEEQHDDDNSSESSSGGDLSRPQRIRFNQDILLPPPQGNIKNGKGAASAASLSEPNPSAPSGGGEESNVAYSLFPQQLNILVVKQNQESCRMQSDSETESLTDSDSNKSIDSSQFCQISLNKDYSLDIYEFQFQDFCSQSILLSTSKFYLVNITSYLMNEQVVIDGQHHRQQQLIKVIDFGYRFLLLHFKDKCLLVSKNFAEQKQHSGSGSGPHSPRSPLLLKKSDSNRGSFRNKNRKSAQANSSSMSIIEEFAFKSTTCDDDHECLDIINAFPININASRLTNVRFTDEELSKLTRCFSSSGSSTMHAWTLSEVINAGGIIDRNEVNAIELLLSDKMTQLIEIKETALVVTTDELFLVEPRFHRFGDLFHSEIVAIVDSLHRQASLPQDGEDSMSKSHIATADGDIITRSKYLVDCFISRSLASNRGGTLANSPGQQFQSWQSWLTRSALLLLQQLKASLDFVDLHPKMSDASGRHRSELIRFHQILKLFEMARTTRKRVICALNYFQFWTQAINFNQKFFTTKMLLELGEEERLFLAHQMFQSLIDKYCHHRDISQQQQLELETRSELYQYYRTFRKHYDARLVMARLLDLRLWEMAEFVANVNADRVSLIHLIIQKYCHKLCQETRNTRAKILDILTEVDTIDWLIYSADYYNGHRSSIGLIERYLNCFVLKQLAHFSSKYLLRLARLLEPEPSATDGTRRRRPNIGWLIDSVLGGCNQTYLRDDRPKVVMTTEQHSVEQTTTLPTIELKESCQPLKRKDMLNLYIFVLLLCVRKIMAKKKLAFSLYDAHFVHEVDRILKEESDDDGPNDDDQVKDSNSSTNASVGCGSFFSFAYNHDKLYIWGQFSYYNVTYHEYHQSTPQSGQQQQQQQLLLSSAADWSPKSVQHYRTPMLVKFFSHTLDGRLSVKMVAGGYKHVLILSDCGLVFTLGCSTFGQLGLGKDVLVTRYPLVVLFDNPTDDAIVKVACGTYHSFAVTNSGRLYSWGWALHGQLGHESIEDEWTPRLVDYFAQKNIKVIDVAGGYYHSVALSDTGHVYVFGENSYGQLGLVVETPIGAANKFRTPRMLTPMAELIKVRLIACGLFHSVAVGRARDGGDADDEIYCWGVDPKSFRNKMRAEKASQALARGRSCSGGEESRFLPNDDDSLNWLQSSSKIRKIKRSLRPKRKSAAHDFEEIQFEDIVGDNDKKKATKDEDTEEENIEFTKVVAGQGHTLLLSTRGRVYVFGAGREGQLGLGSGAQNTQNEYVWLDSLTNIVDIAAGAQHSLAIDREQHCWSFGQNSDYALTTTLKGKSGGGAGGLPTSSSSSRRSSLVNSLLQNAKRIPEDQQVAARLMTLQKNVEWYPVEVDFDFHFAPNSLKKYYLMFRPASATKRRSSSLSSKGSIDWPTLKDDVDGDVEEGYIYRQPEVIKQKLIEALVRYRKELDHRALIKRLDHFELPALNAVVHYSNDQLEVAFQYHLRALQGEVQATLMLQSTEQVMLLEDKWRRELATTLLHLLKKCDQLEQQSIVGQLLLHLENFFLAFDQVVAKIPKTGQTLNMSTVVCGLCLETTDLSPYLIFETLAMMNRQQQQQQDQQPATSSCSSISFTNDQMFALFEHLEQSIGQYPTTKLAKLQALANGLADHRVYECLNRSEAGEGSLRDTFQLEQAWRRILSQFVPPSRPDFNNNQNSGNNNNSRRDMIELELPPASGDIDEQVVIIFRCAHHTFLNELRRLVATEALRATPLGQAYQRLIDRDDEPNAAAAGLERHLDCPQCATTASST